ncbi:MAG: hypothetical protein U0892_20785 [Pirellulales bacterium]
MTPEKTQNNPWVSSGLSKEEPKQKPPIGSRKMEEGDTTKEKTNAADFGSDWDIPERLDTPQIRELLAEFEAMRIRKRKPIRDRKGSSKVLKHFDDQEHLIYALETCIANEYQGLKPDYRKPDRAKPAGPITFEQQRILNTQRAIEDFANG